MGPHLNAYELTTVIAFGAAALAAWCLIRFPSAAPTDVRGVAKHFVAAMLIARFLVPTGITLAGDEPWLRLGGICAFALPALVYVLLAGFWLLSWATQMLGGGDRGSSAT